MCSCCALWASSSVCACLCVGLPLQKSQSRRTSMSGRSPKKLSRGGASDCGWTRHPWRRKGEPAIPGSGSTDAPEIPAAAALRAAQTMTATPPATATARTVRTRIQAGGTSLLSTAQPEKSRAAALPLVTVQSSSEDRPAFPIGVDPSLPRFLRSAQSLFRGGPCDGRASAGRSGYTPQGNFLPLSLYP
jgi:hypothetical protein